MAYQRWRNGKIWLSESGAAFALLRWRILQRMYGVHSANARHRAPLTRASRNLRALARASARARALTRSWRRWRYQLGVAPYHNGLNNKRRSGENSIMAAAPRRRNLAA